jgi:hypothetical protein
MLAVPVELQAQTANLLAEPVAPAGPVLPVVMAVLFRSQPVKMV